MLIVPVVVTGPPVRPVPVATLVTLPLPVPGVYPSAVVTSELLNVTAPFLVLKLVTPVLAMVTLDEPLKEPPDKPVPIVSVPVVFAVTVPLPPRLIAVPLIVMLELASCELVIVPDRFDVGMVELAVTFAPEP